MYEYKKHLPYLFGSLDSSLSLSIIHLSYD